MKYYVENKLLVTKDDNIEFSFDSDFDSDTFQTFKVGVQPIGYYKGWFTFLKTNGELYFGNAYKFKTFKGIMDFIINRIKTNIRLNKKIPILKINNKVVDVFVCIEI